MFKIIIRSGIPCVQNLNNSIIALVYEILVHVLHMQSTTTIYLLPSNLNPIIILIFPMHSVNARVMEMFLI